MDGLPIASFSNKREGFVQIPIEEYDDLKEAEKLKEIPATISRTIVGLGTNGGTAYGETIVNIDMYKLKHQICKQNGIDPTKTTIKFY